jgi:hypothetical protein
MRKAHDRHKVDIESILYTFYQMKVGQSIEKKKASIDCGIFQSGYL